MRLEYDADLFEPERIAAIATDLRSVIRAVGVAPDQAVAALLTTPANEVSA